MAADETIRAYKGEPLQSQADRVRMVSALECVDRALLAPETAYHPWQDCFWPLYTVHPTIWALGPDDAHVAEKQAWVAREQQAGRLALIEAVIQQDAPKPYSTTALIERTRGVCLIANAVGPPETWGAFRI